MSYIFLDESGDLGFNFKKKTHKTLPTKAIKKVNVLHATKEKPITRRRLLMGLNDKKCEIMLMSIYLNKQNVYTRLQDEKQVLYNYITNILLDRIYSKKYIPKNRRVNLVASKRETNKFFNKNFQNYLSSQVQNTHKANLRITIKTPAEEKCLQAVDFVSWAIFRRYEYKDDYYYNIIKSKIIEESSLFS